MRNNKRFWQMVPVFGVGLALLAASPATAQEKLGGSVKLDGSSTVAPITTATAELFRKEQPQVKVTVGVSGTGGGFKKFLDAAPNLRTDISDASRPIKPTEASKAAELGLEFIELPIAFDGLAIVAHPGNTWCDHLTIEELKRIWEPNSKINNWKDVRPGFPDKPLKLYGPGTDSGTFDYFTEAVVGKEDASRSDFMASENDNVLVQGVSGDAGALGYFGYSYYESNKAKLKLLAIDNGDGKPVKPNHQTIHDGSYKPLSRPLFIYVNKQSAARPEVKAFVRFLFANAKKIVEHPKVNYVALGPELYGAILARFEGGVAGTVYADSKANSKTLTDLFGGKK